MRPKGRFIHIQIVQILLHTNLNLVSWLLALEATEPVFKMVTQNGIGTDKYSSHFSTAKEVCEKATFFFI